MSVFTKKDVEMLVNITRTSLKAVILTAMYLLLTTIPGLILTGILSLMTNIETEDLSSLRITCWIICMVISFIGIMINLNQEENVK